jgi:hypothetical protein
MPPGCSVQTLCTVFPPRDYLETLLFPQLIEHKGVIP